MEIYIPKSWRQFIAMVLCVTMLLPMMPVSVFATESADVADEIVVETTVPVTEAPAEALTEVPAETAVPTDAPAPQQETEAESSVPECDCGNAGNSDLTGHADGCARKQHFKAICDLTAEEIYAQWSSIPEDGQNFILTYLSWTNQTKLEELNKLIENGSSESTDPTDPSEPTEPETPVEDTATAPDGETVINASGIPEGSQLNVTEASDETKAIVDAYVAEQGDSSAEQLFVWDISLLDGENAEVQPDGTVRVELEIPGVTLHKYATVYVVHVDDAGTAEKIPASVTEDGKIAFLTSGFSTFAGFTVDFAYNGEEFSINGYETILLSQLFDVLRMPLYVSDVANVEFTNYELIAVEEQADGDWLLTSLQAFQTTETLTVTMDDGTVYEIVVTDASYVTISFNDSGNLDGGTLGVVEWYLLGDGSYGTAYTSGGNYAPGWTEDYDIYIDGTNATNKNFEIVLQRYSGATGRTLYVDLHTIWIKGGANLTFRLGASITKENTDQVIIRQVRGYKNDNYGDSWWFGELFWVENGSLELKVPYTQAGGVHEGVQMVFDWDSDNNNVPSGNGPKSLVSLRQDATSFKANNCVFQNTEAAAIVCRADNLTEFTMTDCTFTNTSKSGGNGSAIYTYAKVGDDNADEGIFYDYSKIHRFELNNVTFTNCTAGGYGGAVALHGYIHSGLITGSSFTNCTTTGQGGGAISINGSVGDFTISDTTFENCTSKYRGGAVAIRSSEIYNNGGDKRWTRSNTLSVSGCTFTNCDSTASHGGGIAVESQLHTLNVSDCDFTNCDAKANGGGISIDARDLPDDFKDGGSDWAAAIETCTTCADNGHAVGTPMTGNYNWLNKSDSTKTVDNKSWINTVNITDNCTFTNCTAIGTLDENNVPSTGNGGGIEFAYGCYIKDSVTISGATIDGCQALGEGSAIFCSNCYVKSMSLTDSTIQNCGFHTYSEGPGGTVKVTGNTTIVLDVQRCQFLNNYSHHHGGGLYWNAARILDGLECEATVNDCLFQGNTAEQYGGGLYVESKMTITKCNIKENTAYMGGGIAQQVYNNPGARMLDEGGVTELKLDPQTWIHHNSANLGGGVSIRANETDSIEDGSPIAYTVRFELNGAAVYQNKATKTSDGEDGHGGGIYFIAEKCPDNADKQAEVDKFTKVILINAGTGTAAAVYNNTAEGNGGGIYMDSSENTELRVQGGYISTNIASGDGGGIYMTGKNATCYVEGGTIGGEGNDSAGNPLANQAVRAEDADTGGNGGGIAISGGAKIEMTGGTISYNQASQDGGGIWLDARADGGILNQIAIDEGSIIYNSAGNNGGGISMKYDSNAVLTGGEVSHNTAAYNGGGIEVYYYADLEVSGGTIEANTATNGSGGGIYSIWYGDINIKDGSTIKSNAAPKGKGGGLFAQKYNVYISGGEITENSAADGGGICIGSDPDSGYVTSISGGDIYKNTVTNRGGGIFNRGSTKFTVSGGNIYENEAKNGAGIYGDQSGSITISSGSIHNNTATNRGGGVYLDASSIFIEGGAVYSNKGPGSGGGICVMTNGETGSSVIMSGGDLYKNSADNGWGGGIYMWGVNSSVTISGGNIYENTASGCGGGINAEYSSTVDITGGSIYKNTAGTYGGGIHSYNSAIITMKGGSIYENTAGEAGGGISLRNGSTAIVTNDTTTGTVGSITKNTAARGGGVSVESGAELTVTNGYITYNKAVGMPDLDTALKLNTELKGTGGGIYVATGNSADDPAKFTLDGSQYAIYGNLADFAADDVFANSNFTKLNVPKKADMDLAGYDFKPEGWFEDYPTNDANYESGLSLAASGSGITNGNVYRYRNSDYSNRVLISDDVVDSDGDATTKNVNDANVYVCMTLGIPAAIPDTVVIDYGLPVDINVLGNEHMYVKDETYLVSLGAARDEVDGSDWTKTDALGGYKKLTLKFGTAEITEDNKVRYTPTTMAIDSVDTFSYAVKYSNVENPEDTDYYFYYANVTVIPATTIYYEDEFVDFTIWEYGDYTTEDDVNKVIAYDWTSVESASAPNQAEDRPGDGLSDVDAGNIYGYDGAYTEMATYSMGSAKMVTVNADTFAEAQFTFYGTGFDVISLTSGSTGTIMVDVFKTAEFINTDGTKNYGATPVVSRMVDTYYGYQYTLCNVTYLCTGYDADGEPIWERSVDSVATGTTEESPAVKKETPAEGEKITGVEYAWIVDSGATNTLYQVPVMKVNGLDYGQYTALITVYYLSSGDHQNTDGKNQYDFYLDAIRIYDPANDGANNEVIEDAYVADGEGWPEYFELRNLIISKNTFDSLGDDAVSGIVFIDNTLDTDKNTVNSIEDYTNYGPNNEVYLAPGQSIAFQLAVPDNVANIHLAMKSVGGTAKVKVYDAADSTHTSVTPETIATATDLYYDITSLNNKTVVITNTGESADAILSITNVKVTYTSEQTDSIENGYFITTQSGGEEAVASLMMMRAPAEPDVPEETEPETTEPEVTEPETTVPEETEPETTVPEETEPETTGPETTEPEETEPEVFAPDKFEVRVSDSTPSKGSVVVVTVTSSADVEYIMVNGKKITQYSTIWYSGNRSWSTWITVEEAGEMDVSVICYNAEDLASETVTKALTVSEKSLLDKIKDLIGGWWKP